MKRCIFGKCCRLFEVIGGGGRVSSPFNYSYNLFLIQSRAVQKAARKSFETLLVKIANDKLLIALG